MKLRTSLVYNFITAASNSENKKKKCSNKGKEILEVNYSTLFERTPGFKSCGIVLGAKARWQSIRKYAFLSKGTALDSWE